MRSETNHTDVPIVATADLAVQSYPLAVVQLLLQALDGGAVVDPDLRQLGLVAPRLFLHAPLELMELRLPTRPAPPQPVREMGVTVIIILVYYYYLIISRAVKRLIFLITVLLFTRDEHFSATVDKCCRLCPFSQSVSHFFDQDQFHIVHLDLTTTPLCLSRFFPVRLCVFVCFHLSRTV